MHIIYEYLRNFWMVFAEISPWLLTGFLISGIIALILTPEQVKHHLSRHGLKPILKAVLLGVPLPLCSCGVIPVATALRKEGAGKGATGAFYVSTPQTGVDSMLVTWSMIGLPMAVLRVVLAALSGITGGVLIDRLGGKNTPLASSKPEKHCCCHCETEKVPEKKDFYNALKFIFHYGFVKMVKSTAPTLLLGVLIAALIQQLVPANFGAEYIGGHAVLEFAVVILFSLPLYVCSTASVPIAAALMLKGFSPGAALVFMIAGPAANSVSITSMKSLLGTRSTILAMLSIIFWTILAGIAVNAFDIPFTLLQTTSSDYSIPVWKNITGIVLSALLLKGLIDAK